jgi:hypothetical protein
MTQEELDRFLRAVHRERFVDYLGVGPGEAAQTALDQRLRWASRALSDPGNAAEASFLLQHQDALRAHLKQAADAGYDEEWIEFADAGEENVRASVWVGHDATRDDALDLGAFDLADEPPRPQAEPQRPAGPPPRPRPASLAPVGPPAPDLTPPPMDGRYPSPAARARQVEPPPSRRRTPTPSISRMTPKPAAGYRGDSAGPTTHTTRPLIPPASPYATPGRPTSNTPSPQRGGAPTPHRAASPSPSRARSPSPLPGYTAPADLGPTPAGAARGPSAVPAPGRGFDVHIQGSSDFMRNNDPYGTSSVVYESELTHGRGARTPRSVGGPSRLTPNSAAAVRGEGDILSSLRSTARKGTPPPVVRVVGRRKQYPILGILGVVGLVVMIGWAGFAALNNRVIRESIWPPPPPEVGPETPKMQGVPVTGTPPPQIEDPTSVAPDAPDAQPVVGPAGDASSTPTEPSGTAPAAATTAAPPPAAPKPKPKPKPVTTTAAATAITTTATETPKTETPTTETPKTETPKTETPVEPPPPDPPKGPLAGAWKGTVGQMACVGDLTQRDDTVSGTITVAGTPFKVSGRHNPALGSILLRGVTDSSVEFRGEIRDGRVTGTARLGAGEMQQAWQLRK